MLLQFLRAREAGDPYAFRFEPQDYVLTTAGGASRNARFDWTKELLADLQAVRLPGRDPAVLRRVGETLRSFVKDAGWAEYEREIAQALAERRPVFLSIRSSAAELYALPWELLTLKSGQSIGEEDGLLLRYEWPDSQSTADPRPAEGGRILVAWSAAGGAVPAAEHIQAIVAGCAKGFHPFNSATDMLAHASLSRIAETLEAAQQAGPPIAVLHLLCHGGAAGSTFGLCLDGEAGPVVVDAGQVRKQLQPFASMVRLVVLSACDSGNPGGLGNHLGSVAQELHRGGVQSVLASRFPLSVAGSIQLTESFYDTLLFGPASVESAFLFARKRLCRGETNLPGEQRRLDWTSVQLYARHDDGDDTRPIVFRPFRGLLAFLPEHDRFFFGRAREVEKLVQALSTLTAAGKPRFLVVAGDSGSGKSSLVLAGAVPRLLEKASGAVQVAKLRPGSDPQAALDDALKSRPKGAATPVLLIIDQFEELFTHGADAALRKTFVNRLWKLASDAESGVSVLLTLRVDFLGRCSEIPLDGTGVRLDHIVYDESYRVFVPHMGSSEMKSAIEEPLGRVGLQLADGLLTRMLSDVGMEPGALPLLQDTLDLLWQRRQGRVLGQTAYDSLGGVTGALKGRADALIDALTEFEQLMARRLLVRLVSMTRGADAALATRQRVALITLRPPKEEDAACSDRVLAKLVEARLLVLSQEGEEQQVEVAHEALIRQWPRLHEWLRADGERLAALAEFADWVKQWREHGTLLVREQLEYAETIVKRCQEDLGSDARQLLEASRTHRHNERRVGRRLLVLAIALVAMVFPALLSPCSSDQGTPGEHLAKLTTITFLFGMLFSFVIIIFSIFAAARKAWRIFATRKRQGAAVSIGKKKRSLPPQL